MAYAPHHQMQHIDFVRVGARDVLEGFVARHLNAHRVGVKLLPTNDEYFVTWTRQRIKRPAESVLEGYLPHLPETQPHVARVVEECGECLVPERLVRRLVDGFDGGDATKRLGLLLDTAEIMPQGAAYLVADVEVFDNMLLTRDDGRTWRQEDVVHIGLRQRHGTRTVELSSPKAGFPSAELRAKLLVLA